MGVIGNLVSYTHSTSMVISLSGQGMGVIGDLVLHPLNRHGYIRARNGCDRWLGVLHPVNQYGYTRARNGCDRWLGVLHPLNQYGYIRARNGCDRWLVVLWPLNQYGYIKARNGCDFFLKLALNISTRGNSSTDETGVHSMCVWTCQLVIIFLTRKNFAWGEAEWGTDPTFRQHSVH